MSTRFHNIGVAYTGSPTGDLLLREAERLCRCCGAQLHILSVIPERDDTLEQKARQALPAGTAFIWHQAAGEPADSLLRLAKTAGLSLLMVGALPRENVVGYYLGSVARQLMREPGVSILVRTFPEEAEAPVRQDKVAVVVDAEYHNDETVKAAYDYAVATDATELILIRELSVPGLAIAVHDTGSTDETENLRNRWIAEEENKLRFYAGELQLRQIAVKPVCLFGKEGFEANEYVRDSRIGMLAVTAPRKKQGLLHKLFRHDEEHIFHDLSSSLLIIKENK